VRAYVVFCHPRRDSFTGAALDRVLAGLATGGHEVRVSDLYADGFAPELDAAAVAAQRIDHRGHPGLRPGIQPYVDHLLWCDALVLVHPTWWSGQPAMLKGFFDRVLVKGVAWDLPDGSDRIRPRLTHVRRLVVVTSHGSPKRTNALQGESGKRIVGRSLRSLCGWRCRFRWVALYNIDRADDAARATFLDRVEERLTRL
jgi:NAD(P)H dehydrogenase (quinone)